MSPPSESFAPLPYRSSLCNDCAYVRIVVSGRGSQFVMCRLGIEDSRFAKYPAQPVWSCSAFTKTPPEVPDSPEIPEPDPPSEPPQS